MEPINNAITAIRNKWSQTVGKITTAGITIAIISCLLIFVFVYPFTVIGSPTKGPEKLGPIGDFVGGLLNPLLSFGAFIILINTFRQQRKDGAQAETNHNKMLENQRFFDLISLTHESARGVHLTLERDLERSPASSNPILATTETFENHLAIGQTWKLLKPEVEKIEITPEEYERVYKSRMKIYIKWRTTYWPIIGSYFETVLFIIEQYATYDVSSHQNAQSEFYARIIRHQMTTSERNILFYEMLHSDSYYKLMSKLNSNYFWRGGGDGMDSHRAGLIQQAENHHSANNN
ncbi:putative phage abortive infection protein [Pseudomonas shirazensis]|uniref:putative phage abortive infection protein n=1 Tax=Pseudomonas shirazensis TaxID=2745494 RepID=UPI003D272EB1